MRISFFLPALLLVIQSKMVMGQPGLDGCPIFECLPPFAPVQVEPCTDQCRVGVHSDCGPNGNCCQACRCTQCFPGNPNPPVDPCQNKVCPSGQVCVTEPCRGRHCTPRARCVREPMTKPGTCRSALIRCAMPQFPSCPKPSCRDDSDCTGDAKCCLASDCSGCRRCERPLESRITCAKIDCFPDQVCIEDPQPRCVPRSFKPGSCPASSGLVTICLFDPARNCLSDAQCSGDLKCCNDGCGSVCKTPIRRVVYGKGDDS